MPTSRTLPAELTIYHVAALRSEWLGWLEKPPKTRRKTAGPQKDWPLDASPVVEIDASGIQLLLALSKSLAERHSTLKLLNPSRPVTAACESAGLTSLLGIDAATGASA